MLIEIYVSIPHSCEHAFEQEEVEKEIQEAGGDLGFGVDVSGDDTEEEEDEDDIA